jgi:hypothetical protein
MREETDSDGRNRLLFLLSESVSPIRICFSYQNMFLLSESVSPIIICFSYQNLFLLSEYVSLIRICFKTDSDKRNTF